MCEFKHTIEQRRHVVAIVIAEQLEDSSTKDIAEWLVDFQPIPQQDPELLEMEFDNIAGQNGLEEWIVWDADNNYHQYTTREDAMAYFKSIHDSIIDQWLA